MNKTLALIDHRPEIFRSPLGNTEEVDVVEFQSGQEGYEKLFEVLVQGRKRIRKGDYNIILVNDGRTIGLAAYILSKIYSIPVVVRLGGDFWMTNTENLRSQIREKNISGTILYFILRLINNFLFNRVLGFIVVSKDLKEKVSEKTSTPEERIQVCYPPIRIAQECIAKKEGSEKHFNILTVTNLRFEGKFLAVKDGLECVAKFLSDHPNAEYHIAGGGKYINNLREEVESIEEDGLRNRITILGYVDDIESMYNKADVFLYFSYLDGFPNVVTEAKVAGLPVITNPKFGMCEQVEDGVTGFHVSPNDCSNTIEKLTLLLSDRNIQERIGRNARETVLHRQSQDAVRRQMKNALSNIYSYEEQH